MLNSGKKIRALRDKKNNILTLVLSEKTILNETKNHTPPFQVKWSFPYVLCFYTPTLNTICICIYPFGSLCQFISETNN